MGREDVEREFVLLANECDSLTHRLKAIAARPLEDLRISVADLRAVLAQYGVRFSQAELEEMLWEADDDMDGSSLPPSAPPARPSLRISRPRAQACSAGTSACSSCSWCSATPRGCSPRGCTARCCSSCSTGTCAASSSRTT